MRVDWCALALVLFVGACNKPKPLPTEKVEGAQAEAAAAQRFAGMTATERAAELAKMPLAGSDAAPERIEALLQSAANDAERAALGQAARPRFAAEYVAVLAQKKKPGQVSTAGAGGTTLLVKGEYCSKFLLENFVGSPDAKTAKRIGFTRLACESKALKLVAEL